MMRTGLIVDVTNLYFEVQTKFPGKRLRLIEYTKELESRGHFLTFKIAYSRQAKDAAQSFTHMLACNGFETHFGQNSWAVAMALRSAQILPNIDVFVLGSNAEEMGRILVYGRDMGKITKCFAANIPAQFAQWAECIELTERVLDDDPKKAKRLVVPSDSRGDGTQLQS